MLREGDAGVRPDPFPPSLRSAVIAYYGRATARLERHFGGTPLVTATFPRGMKENPKYRASLHHPPPPGTPTLEVPLSDGVVDFLAFSPDTVDWECRHGAIELLSWTPRRDNPTRPQFGRILLKTAGPKGRQEIAEACGVMRKALARIDLDAIPILTGDRDAALWIPLDGKCTYKELRNALHFVVHAAEQLSPNLITGSPTSEGSDRIHAHVRNNAVGLWSVVVLSVRGADPVGLAVPCSWETLDTWTHRSLAFEHVAPILDELADAFDAEVARIGSQHLVSSGPRTFLYASVPMGAGGHEHVLDAARRLFADKEAWSAEDLCARAIEEEWVEPGSTPRYFRNAIRGFIGRQTLRGERPEFVELPDGRFRLNVRVDPFAGYPQIEERDPELEAFVERLNKAAARELPRAPEDKADIGGPFERAVADWSTRLGFVAKRHGGRSEPDVVAIAPMGWAQYTVVFECKSRESSVKNMEVAGVAETARARDAVKADYGVIVAPRPPDEQAIDKELAAHRVALWAVDDLIALARAHAEHPIGWPDLIPLFAPGRASQRIADFCEEHRLGAYRRATLAYRLATEEGLKYQHELAHQDPLIERTDAPLTAEALAVLMNERAAKDDNLGRFSVDDVRTATDLATHPTIASMRRDGKRLTIVREPQDPKPAAGD